MNGKDRIKYRKLEQGIFVEKWKINKEYLHRDK